MTDVARATFAPIPQDSMHGYVIRELQASKGRWPKIAESTGISIRTIRKIATQEVADPGVSFVERLAAHFRQSAAS